MKKITLAEKIARAEARVAETEAALARCEARRDKLMRKNWDLSTAMHRLLKCDVSEITASDKRWYWRALADKQEIVQQLDWANWHFDCLSKQLISQRRYLHRLQAMQAEIERQNAEEDAYIDAMITLAGAIA